MKAKKRSRVPQRNPAPESDPDARLNVTLPASVHQQVKVKAAENRQSIRDYILQLLAADGIAL